MCDGFCRYTTKTIARSVGRGAYPSHIRVGWGSLVAMRVRRTTRTSAVRNFPRLIVGSAFSNLADGVLQVALPLLAVELTDSPGWVAGVAFARTLPWLLFALQAGALADRLDRRRTMAMVQAARVVIVAALAALTALDQGHLAVLYIAAFALGIAETLFDTSAQSIVPAVVGRGDDLSRSNGRLYAVEIIMNQFVGPPLGGFLSGIAIALAMGSSSAAYVVAGLAVASLTGTYRPERSGPTTRLRTDIAEGLRYLWGNRVLRQLAMTVGGLNLGSNAVFAVLPVFAVAPGPLGLSEFGYGTLLAFAALGSLIGSAIAAPLERRLGRSLILVISVVGCGIPLLLFATGNVAVVGFAGLMEGVAVILWNVVTVSLRQRIVPDELLGRLNASYRLVAWGTMPIGAAIGGVLAELTSIRTVFIVAGVGTLLIALPTIRITNDRIQAAEAAAGLTDLAG